MATNIISENHFFMIFSCLLALSSYVHTCLASCDHAMLTKHEKWMAKHSRYYDSREEKEKRFQIFKDNVEFIERFNNRSADGNLMYKVGVNKFADLSNEEFLAKYMGYISVVPTTSYSTFEYENVRGEVPPSVDWNAAGAVTPVGAQGQCGCGWIFSAVAAMEGIVQIKTGTLESLSVQQILDCYGGFDPCNGGQIEDAFDFVMRNDGQLASDADYPYQMEEGTCGAHVAPSSIAATITSYERVPPNNEVAMLLAVVKQPVSVGIDATGLQLQFYKSGVFADTECGTEINHAVTAVGYGTDENGTKFWLLKNSWGPNWGENGYVRVQRDVDVKEGMCGVAMHVIYPTTAS